MDYNLDQGCYWIKLLENVGSQVLFKTKNCGLVVIKSLRILLYNHISEIMSPRNWTKFREIVLPDMPYRKVTSSVYEC